MTLSLDILQPDGPALHEETDIVRGVDATGAFGLLPGHENFCTALVPSILSYRQANGGERYVAVDGGVLMLEDGHVSVVTRDAVLSDDLESVSEAVISMLRTRKEQEQEAAQVMSRLVAELLEQLPQLEARR